MKLDNTRLLVENFAACFRFYRDAMGFEVTWGKEDENYASFKTGTAAYIAIADKAIIAKAVGTDNLPANATAQDRFALIFEVDDVDAAAEKIKANGGNVFSGPTDQVAWGIRVAHLRDPDGNLIEIMHPLVELS